MINKRSRLIYRLTMLIMLISLIFPVMSVADAQPLKNPVPMAAAKEPSYTFPPTPEGVMIEHEFIIQNFGYADLIINRVNTG